MISIKTKKEIELMRKAGKIVKNVLDSLQGFIKPGITTEDLDNKAEMLIKKEGGQPAFKGYKGFPGNICTSLNSVVVHGIPNSEILRAGDIISVDIGVMREGYYADSARTFKVGKIGPIAQRLIDITRKSLFEGIEQARPGNHLSNISHAVQKYVESNGYSVVRALVGHGIGSKIHEAPEIPNFGAPEKGPILKPGMTLAIEPMVNEGSFEVELLEDGWTIVTKDKKLSAHFEHTILVTSKKPEILT